MTRYETLMHAYRTAPRGERLAAWRKLNRYVTTQLRRYVGQKRRRK